MMGNNKVSATTYIILFIAIQVMTWGVVWLMCRAFTRTTQRTAPSVSTGDVFADIQYRNTMIQPEEWRG